MSLFNCTNCGAQLEVDNGVSVVTCKWCNKRQPVPKKLDITLEKFYEEANSLRIEKEFDRAIAIYDQIIIRDKTQSEAYWGRILCKYGIEYIDDTTKNKKVPTCHIAIFDTVANDADYKKTLQYADDEQRVIYKKSAEEIDKIHKKILELARKGEKYDVFICYKQTDENDKRTKDSVLAEKIYNKLSKKGIKVFFAHITLQDKLGDKYEPIIFSALNSAKVMLVVGTKPEYFNSVWVKNEWSRYLKIIQSDSSKYLIPCFCDMSANNLPEELRSLQAKDMSEIAFELDLEKGVEKILGKDKEPIPPVPPIEKAKDATIEEPKNSKKIAKAVIPMVALILLIAIFFTVVLPIIQNRRGDTVPQPDTQDISEATDKHTNANNTLKNETDNIETDVPNNDSNGSIEADTNDDSIITIDEAALAPFEFTRNRNECVITGLKDKNATNVVIPNGVTSIGNSAFDGCEKLTSIKIPNSVTSIGNVAFFYCEKLTSIKIPNSVTSIGNGAFDGCKNLTSITIPNSVTSIGESVFSLCSKLTNISVDVNNTKYKSINGNLYTKDEKTLVCYAVGKTDESFTIPNSVTSIGDSAFEWCSKLTSITIPNSVTSIGRWAFSYCSNLTSITIPNGVTSIGDYAFSSCFNLTSITIPNSITSIGESAFFGCSKLTNISVDVNNTKYKSINGNIYTKDEKTLVCYAEGKTDKSFTIPNSVTSIGRCAFSSCKNLTSITIPNSVTSIGGHAFSYCTNLTSITIPNSVTSIGNYAFSGCENLTSVTFENTSGWSAGSTSISSVDLSNPSTAAEYLKNTYCDSSWKRS